MKITLKDIAEQAGVSIATVSRVLNGQAEQYRLKKETVDAVLLTAQQLGFSPYKAVFTPPDSQSKVIGLVVPDISHHFLGQLARSIRMEAEKSGYNLLVCDSNEDTDKEKESIQLLLNSRVDGLIVLPVGKEYAHLQNIYNQGVNLVVVDRIFKDLNCPMVGVDNYTGAFEAIEMLIRNGHRRIACLQRLPHSWINNERLRAFRDVHQQYGIPIDESIIIGDTFGKKDGYLEAKLLFSGRYELPTAIFAMSHLMVLGAMQVIREQGLNVPEDISIAGFDDIPYSQYFNSPLTTVKQPVEEMGMMALNLLLEQVAGAKRDNPVTIQLPTKLVFRNSVKAINRQEI